MCLRVFCLLNVCFVFCILLCVRRFVEGLLNVFMFLNVLLWICFCVSVVGFESLFECV